MCNICIVLERLNPVRHHPIIVDLPVELAGPHLPVFNMNQGIVYACISMVFAGVTAVLAKFGMTNISGDMAVTVRTCFAFVFTLLFAFICVPRSEFALLDRTNFLWLGCSAATTMLSWLFYYRAIKIAEVSTVALIDKGSVVVAMLLAFLFLHDAVTPAKLGGCALIVVGLIVIARG